MPVISIRVSDEWLARLDAECSVRIWKRNAAIVNLVWMALSGSGEIGSRASLTRKCPPVVSGLGVNGSSPSSPNKNCPSCGGLNGMHQMGCASRKQVQNG